MYIEQSSETADSRETARLAACREYFEVGCRCLAEGAMPAAGSVSAKDAFQYYRAHCRCSRNYTDS